VKGHGAFCGGGTLGFPPGPFHDKASFPSLQATRLCHSSYANLNMRSHSFYSNALDTVLSLSGIQFSLTQPQPLTNVTPLGMDPLPLILGAN
jgi:hypothetical protein